MPVLGRIFGRTTEGRKISHSSFMYVGREMTNRVVYRMSVMIDGGTTTYDGRRDEEAKDLAIFYLPPSGAICIPLMQEEHK